MMTGLMLAALFVAGCGVKEVAPKPKEVKEEPAAKKEQDAVQHKVLSFNLEGLNEHGAKKWDVTGQSAEAVTESQVKLDNIVANAYGEEAQATITGDKGVYDKTKNSVMLEKNVKATIVSTQGFGADFAGLSGEVTPASGAKKEPDNAGKKMKTVITCDGEVRFDYENNQAYFTKNVKVVGDDGDIYADKITVNLEPATRKLKEIIAEGNVRIKRGENITYSDKATYVEAEKKVILTGSPKLVIYQEGSLQKNMLGK